MQPTTTTNNTNERTPFAHHQPKPQPSMSSTQNSDSVYFTVTETYDQRCISDLLHCCCKGGIDLGWNFLRDAGNCVFTILSCITLNCKDDTTCHTCDNREYSKRTEPFIGRHFANPNASTIFSTTRANVNGCLEGILFDPLKCALDTVVATPIAAAIAGTAKCGEITKECCCSNGCCTNCRQGLADMIAPSPRQ